MHPQYTSYVDQSCHLLFGFVWNSGAQEESAGAPKTSTATTTTTTARAAPAQPSPKPAPAPSRAPPSAAPKKMLRATYDCVPDQQGDLAFKKGDMIELVSEEPGDGWVTGRLNGVEGILPLNYVQRV